MVSVTAKRIGNFDWTAMAIQTINPSTGEVVKTFDLLTPEEIEARLARAAAGSGHTSGPASVNEPGGCRRPRISSNPNRPRSPEP